MLSFKYEQRCARGFFSRDRDLEARERGQDQDVQSRGRGETKAFEISTEARPSRGTTAPRDGLKTEATSLSMSMSDHAIFIFILCFIIRVYNL